MVKQDRLREEKIAKRAVNHGPKVSDHLFARELDDVIDDYQEMEKNGGKLRKKKYKKKLAPASVP